MKTSEPESNPVEEVVGPYHDFWLLPAEDRPPKAGVHEAFSGRRDAPVRLADDLLRHELGALKSVQCMNPATHAEPVGMGLHLYGPSVIFEDGARELESILDRAIERLSEMPEYPVLTWGTWTLSDEHGNATTAPRPHRVRLDRNATVEQLRKLAHMAAQVQQDPGVYLLHLGI